MTQAPKLPGGGKARPVVPDDVRRRQHMKALKQQAEVGLCAVDLACVDSFCCVGHGDVDTCCTLCVTTQANRSHKNGGVDAVLDHLKARASSTGADFMAAFMEQKAEQMKLDNAAKRLELEERRLRLKQLEKAASAASASDGGQWYVTIPEKKKEADSGVSPSIMPLGHVTI